MQTSSPRRPELYGWLIVAAASVIMGMGMGSLFSISVFLKPISTEFGWLRGDTAFAYSSAAAMNGLAGIMMGALADRFSTRPVVIFGALVLGTSLILLGTTTALWQFYLFYGPLMGGLGLSAFVTPLLANAGFWFERNRGLAIGTVMGGQSLGGAVVPVVSGFLISGFGWREAYTILGITVFAIVLPLTLLIREAPGVAEAKAASRAAIGRSGRRDIVIEPGRLAAVLCGAIMLCCICMSVPVVHLVALATDKGIPGEAAASIMAVMMLFSIAGRVGVGKLADLIGGVRALLAVSTVQTAFIFWFTQMETVPGFYAISFLFGVGYGGVIPSYAIILREFAPVHLLGRFVGLIFFFANMGMATGGYMGGALFDLTGTYTVPYALGAASGIANMIVVGTLLYYIGGRRTALRARAAAA